MELPIATYLDTSILPFWGAGTSIPGLQENSDMVMVAAGMSLLNIFFKVVGLKVIV